MRVRTALIQQVGSLAKMTEGRQVPPRSPAPPCRQGSSRFLAIRVVVRGQHRTDQYSHWPGSIVHHLWCPFHRVPWDYHYWRVLV